MLIKCLPSSAGEFNSALVLNGQTKDGLNKCNYKRELFGSHENK